MKLSHLTCTFIHTLEMFLSVEPVIIMMTDDDDDDDDDDVRQTETSWRRPTSAELTLTYLTLSASYKVTTCQNSVFYELQISHQKCVQVSKIWLRNYNFTLVCGSRIQLRLLPIKSQLAKTLYFMSYKFHTETMQK